jgi:lambda family phage portal protein
VLNCLVNNVVGPKGIGVDFQPKNKNGEINRELADALQDAHKKWAKRPETTGEYSLAKAQRLMARAWFRDGECLSKAVTGEIPSYQHLSDVPFSLELLEADFLANVDDHEKGIFQGVQRNGWGRPTYYHFYKRHPGDKFGYNVETIPIRADIINHVKMVDRIRQARGVSVFASVMNRLNDLKDYEEAERVAARISASMVAYIKRGGTDMYEGAGDGAQPRTIPFAPGMTFDDLMPGEDVGTISSNRPSALLQPFRDSMLKAVASGASASYSTISKNYDGTYSSQRQELVEQWANYAVLSDEFISMEVEPTTERFITFALLSGVKVPPEVDRATLFDVEYICPSMPWIDPAKEATGHEKRLALKLKSPQQIIRSAGDRPEDVLDQWQRWNQELKARQITVEVDGKPAPRQQEEELDDKE